MRNPPIDGGGRLTFGKHRGRSVDAVADDEPSYLRWVLENVDLGNEDAMIIRTHLKRRGET